MLLAAYVALRRGDAVGVQTFGGRDLWLPPRRGRDTLQRILGELYSVDATLTPPDYADAARKLLERQKRRALLIVLTNLRDEDDAELAPTVATLKSRHVVLTASLRESALRDAVAREVRTFDDALLVAGAVQYAEHRARQHERLRASGVRVLDVEPEALPIALVNEYLDIKRAQRL